MAIPRAVAEAADTLEVPAEEQAAFAEFYGELQNKGKGEPPCPDRLRRWKHELQSARAVATVHEFLSQHQDKLEAAKQDLQALGDADKVGRMLEQRFVFLGVYGTSLSLAEAFDRLLGEIREQLESTKRDGGFYLAKGTFGKDHEAVREAAYPYTPACGSSCGDAVLNCFSADTDELAGYMAAFGSYADDVSVNPRFHGRRVAKALVCGTATHLLAQGEEEMSLDVRACNLPAVALYKALGFRVAERRYPAFYDWHGGFSMRASTREVAEGMPEGFDAARPQ